MRGGGRHTLATGRKAMNFFLLFLDKLVFCSDTKDDNRGSTSHSYPNIRKSILALEYFLYLMVSPSVIE